MTRKDTSICKETELHNIKYFTNLTKYKVSPKNGNFANSIFQSWWIAFFIKGKNQLKGLQCHLGCEILQRQRLQICYEETFPAACSHFSDEICHFILIYLGTSILWLDKQVLFSSTSPGLFAGKQTLFVWHCPTVQAPGVKSVQARLRFMWL